MPTAVLDAQYQKTELQGGIKGFDYDAASRFSLRNIKDMILMPKADFYLCGPIPFMDAQQWDLESLEVALKRIYSEVFGAS
jgi:nitric oxide dioxygenase